MDLIESYSQELRLIDKPRKGFYIALLLLTLVLLPWFGTSHLVYVATVTFIYAIGVQGQNILIGYTGQISLGQAGFMSIGAFTFGHLSGMGVPLPLGLLGAGILSGLFGILVGFPSLRLKGPYLAIATLGFGIAVYQFLTAYEVLSGGRMGLIVKKLPPFLGFTKQMSMYYFSLGLALGFTLLSYNLISSCVGRAFIAIRDNDIAAEVMGVNLTRYKLLSFAISSFYTGIHGAMRWAYVDLPDLSRRGFAERPVTEFRPRCRTCGTPGEKQLRRPKRCQGPRARATFAHYAAPADA